MLKNYLTIALRNLRRHKGYAFINVAGLAVGLAVCLVIGLFVQFKLSYDRFHPNADRVYRLYQINVTQGAMARTPPGITQALETALPEIERANVLWRSSRRLFHLDAEPLFIENVVSTDEHFFEVFPYRLLQGDPQTALAGPGRLVLTRSQARTLFGDDDPIGRVLTYENTEALEITGIVADPPGNAHFQFNALRSLSEKERAKRYGSSVDWAFFGDYTYLLLHEGVDPAVLEAKIAAFEEAADKPEYMKGAAQLALLPVTRLHLHSKFRDEIAPTSDVRYLYLFSAIGLLILLIACVNYMNLATARSARRAREVGIRKVVGAGRGQLIRQFLSESMLISLLALPLALLLVELTLPLVNTLTGEALRLDYADDGGILLALLGLVLLVGFASGCYPALFLSAFRPTGVLTGHSPGLRRGGIRLRRILVVFQFTATVIFLIGAVVVHRQLDYVQTKRLGFDQEHVVTIHSRALAEHYEPFKQILLESAHVKAVTSGAPPGIGWRSMSQQITDEQTQEQRWMDYLRTDYAYLETLGLTLVAGRSFSPDFPSDADESIILTQAAARQFGIADDPIGQRIENAFDASTVIGVVEDFHNTSLYEPIRPIIIGLRPGFNTVALVRLTPGDFAQKRAVLEQAWARFVPERPLPLAFLDAQIEQHYHAEARFARVFDLFSALAVLIACLGLFGLAAFTAEQRTKEIGIRKVLGASVTGIMVLLSKEFVRLVLVALVLATPVAVLAMNRWLETFAYHIAISWQIFLLAGVAALGIALLTVSYQAIRAALADPVESLRYE